MIHWEDKYSTGDINIDSQHQYLFEFLNNLEKELHKHDSSPEIDKILNGMKLYAEAHFQYEEKCMVICKCPVALDNKNAHEHFLFAYQNFKERYEREGHSRELAWKIHDMIEKWIINHICKIDTQLKQYVTPERGKS